MFENDIKEYNKNKSYSISILYRVCDSILNCNGTPRCFGENKKECIKKCLDSLKENINNLNDNIKFQMYCVYDKCSIEIIEYIKTIYNKIQFFDLNSEGRTGNGQSFAKCCEIAKKLPDNEIVFFLEDDYLFLNDNVLNSIVYDIDELSSYNRKHVALMPDDYPDRYINNRRNCEVRITTYGHYIKIHHTTCTFIMYGDDIRKYYNFLYNFINYPIVYEERSIGLVWQYVPLYSPIPAKTLHAQHKYLVPKNFNFDKLDKYFNYI